jgi:hypothetical protein
LSTFMSHRSLHIHTMSEHTPGTNDAGCVRKKAAAGADMHKSAQLTHCRPFAQ